MDCGHQATFHPLQRACAECDSPWLEAIYDLPQVRSAWEQGLKTKGLQRYQRLLPIELDDGDWSMGEGSTPLLHARNLGELLNLSNLYIKDERQGPTGSFKDRQAAISVAVLQQFGIQEVVVASTGNVALAFSAYCAHAGMKLWAFLTSLVPSEKMHEVALHGAEIIKVTGTYDLTKRLAAEYAERRKLFLDRGTRSVPAVESMKTIAFEIAESLGEEQHMDWRSPDWYIQSVSGGIGPIGVLKGFTELLSMGFTDQIPSLACIQSDGCAPMVSAWESGSAQAEPVLNPTTRIPSLSTGDPGRAYELLRDRMLDSSDGIFTSVSDDEAYQALLTVARVEGISVEPAAAVAFAGLMKLAKMGKFDQNEVIVINCSGHTLPVDQSLLGENWARDIELPMLETPQEGILSALSEIDSARYQEVMIVDDHAPARQLIRRIIQAHGEFSIREASSGEQALEMAVNDPPDILILDLMMPELDGFEVLDRLKEHSATSQTPVIVITAKDLTASEHRRLQGRISNLMQKGELEVQELMDEIEKALD
jgi:threonine synthase